MVSIRQASGPVRYTLDYKFEVLMQNVPMKTFQDFDGKGDIARHAGTGYSHGDELRVITLRVSNLFMINYCYLVVDPVTNQAVIVDPAWELEKIQAALIASNARLSAVLLTHAHPDHTHLAVPLADAQDCPIWMMPEEITASSFRATKLRPIESPLLSVGNFRIECLLTPGHTPGSTCFRMGGNFFTGDVLFAEGCGQCPGPAAAQAMYSSLELLKRKIAPGDRIFPGHSYGKLPGQRFAEVLKENMYLQFKSAETFMAFRLRKGQNLSNMFAFK